MSIVQYTYTSIVQYTYMSIVHYTYTHIRINILNIKGSGLNISHGRQSWYYSMAPSYYYTSTLLLRYFNPPTTILQPSCYYTSTFLLLYFNLPTTIQARVSTYRTARSRVKVSVVYRICSPQIVFSIECVLHKICSVSDVFRIECVPYRMYRMCSEYNDQ